ncbi:MAG: hypothetical protein KME27_12630 [Lyngbya sp. HA4199-MV5]|jgi:hypothetical protein|nr:hypothetical protein [Lyngbya sp. HA4199-MV5]
MPLFTILRVDFDYLHPGSCILVEASSLLAIAQDMLEQPDHWKPLLAYLYPDDEDPRSLWHRMREETITPEDLLSLIHETWAGEEFSLMVRIQPVQVQPLSQLRLGSLNLPVGEDQAESLG